MDDQHKLDNCNDSSDTTVIFIMPQRFQKKWCQMMATNWKKRGFKIRDRFYSGVTHVVSAYTSREDAFQTLHQHYSDPADNCVHFVNSQWLSDCLKQQCILNVEPKYLLQVENTVQAQTQEEAAFPDYECLRATPLNHYNANITDALEILARAADFRKDSINYPRALAFHRAACVFKSLNFKVTTISQVQHLCHIGSHVIRITEDILDSGYSREAEEMKNSDWFKGISVLREIFGVGAAIADKWYGLGLRSITDVKQHPTLPNMDERIAIGLQYHDDLILPVLREEAEAVLELVRTSMTEILPGSNVCLVGGFRRGKASGHDIDILITHPDEGREIGVLSKLIHRLEKQNLLVYGKYEACTCTEAVLKGEHSKGQYLKSTLDHFEKWIGIMKLDSRYRQLQHQDSKKSRIDSTVKPHRNSSANTDKIENTLSRDNKELNESDVDPARGKSVKNGKGQVPSVDNFIAKQNPLKRRVSKVIGCENVRTWYARRVDLIISPWSQYFYALVGWTGSKQFNRSLRTFADKQGMRLSSHALYHTKRKELLQADSEEAVFRHLDVPCRPPSDRNC